MRPPDDSDGTFPEDLDQPVLPTDESLTPHRHAPSVTGREACISESSVLAVLVQGGDPLEPPM
ncbi:hypothetical protein Airi01_057030 [Actinoallomurus iriomotensis]|uniref:Uncharacterized protein n=1 Tax=Actinoallomurus iriomotensis TaxID=478107 RepID=A0A9W6VTA8_9ACTN|nr:hypothetical protein Airi01_057030 [Actinoallomurus iriomotensis]